MADDDLYLWLKGARERLCRAQVSPLLRPGQVQALDRAVREIDRVGAYLPQWSRFDLPTVPDPMDQLDGGGDRG